MDYPPPDGGWCGAPPPAFGVPPWSHPHGPPPDWGAGGIPPDWGPPPQDPHTEWSDPTQQKPEPSIGSEFSKQPSSDVKAETTDENSETASLARAAREWAEWQQRYTEWYNAYYGYAATTSASSSASSAYSTAVTTSVSYTGNSYSKSSYSALVTSTSRTANKTFGSASSVTTTTASFGERNVSNNAAIPLPSKPPVAKPGRADAFAKFAEKAASNLNLALGMSSSSLPQNTANRFVSSSTNASSTSVKLSQGQHHSFFVLYCTL